MTIHLPWRDRRIGDGPTISSSITDAEATALAWLSSGGVVLEIGSAYGYSAVTMARAGARVLAVDPHVELPSRDVFCGNLQAYGVSDLVEMDLRVSQDALPDIAVAGATFSLVFVDGDHRESAVTHDVTWALKLLCPAGVLACHDYGEDCCPDVAAVLDRMFPGGPDELVDTLFVIRPEVAP